MDFLTINDIVLRVVEGSATQRPSIFQGGRERMRAGNLVSSEDPDSEKLVLECQIDLYDSAEELALRAECPRGVAATVAGAWLDALGSLQAVVDIGDAQAWQTIDEFGYLIYKTVSLHIEEV